MSFCGVFKEIVDVWNSVSSLWLVLLGYVFPFAHFLRGYSGNSVKNQGACAVAEALRSNSSLNQLNLTSKFRLLRVNPSSFLI